MVVFKYAERQNCQGESLYQAFCEFIHSMGGAIQITEGYAFSNHWEAFQCYEVQALQRKVSASSLNGICQLLGLELGKIQINGEDLASLESKDSPLADEFAKGFRQAIGSDDDTERMHHITELANAGDQGAKEYLLRSQQ